MRKALWFNYDHYRDLKQHAFKNDGEILRKHVSKSTRPFDDSHLRHN